MFSVTGLDMHGISVSDYRNLNSGSCLGRDGRPSGCSRTPRAVPSGAQQARLATSHMKFNLPESLSEGENV